MGYVPTIALIGPESSGKSTLARYLSDKFGYVAIDEYAREYLVRLNRPYSLNDVLHIYNHQTEKQIECLKGNPPGIVADTEGINIKVWCEEVFGESPIWLDGMIELHYYDLYLLTAPDIPYVPDPLRENPGRGEYFFNRFKDELDKRKLPYVVISGHWGERCQMAMDAIVERGLDTLYFRTKKTKTKSKIVRQKKKST